MFAIPRYAFIAIPSHLPYPLLPSRYTGREEGNVPNGVRDKGR
jgi:hypothetical protein